MNHHIFRLKYFFVHNGAALLTPGRAVVSALGSTGERVLASGSVQLPRFTLLESGSLLISPSHLSDAGSYTCMASNSRGIDEAAADLLVWGQCFCWGSVVAARARDRIVLVELRRLVYCAVRH